MKLDQPLKPTQFAEHQLLTAILNGKFPPGSFLPNERSLSEQIGVTRPTLRETLQRIAGEGWITIQHGKPTLVNEFFKEGGMGLLSKLSKYGEYLPPGFIVHFLEVRRMVLPAVSRMAAENSPEILIEHLTQAKKLTCDPVLFSDYDWQLQVLMAIHSENPILRMIFNDFSYLFKTMAAQYFQEDKAQQASLTYYQKLLQAIKQKDGDNVEKIVFDTMDASVEIWKRFFE